MKKVFLFLGLAAQMVVAAQNGSKNSAAKNAESVISVAAVERIERVLASDDMQGRRAGTPGIDKAAAFIAAEFKKAGLQPLQGNSYLQEFSLVKPKVVSVKGAMDNAELDPKNIIVITTQPELDINERSGYTLAYIKEGENLGARVQAIMGDQKNTVVLVAPAFTNNFPRLAGFRRQLFQQSHSVVFVLGNYEPKTFAIKAEQSLEEVKMANVVGVLPGKSKKEEQVIFSAHYDHLGIGKPVDGDSIYNGANDDAAGTTAVILLANYFKKLNNNERTLVFAAFTAEEMGGFGSQYFSRQFNPQQVVAMFNIEMIGTESKWGPNSAYITGFEKTNMGQILQQNLQGSSFTFHPDPYPDQQLFYRSDNATLARLGVPAHTISTAKMDEEKYYHSVDDEIETLNLPNMAQIIKAIATSSKTIVAGKDTPSRVNTSELR